MRVTRILCLFLLAAPPLAAQRSRLEDVRWLEGCWQMTRGASLTMERWSAVAQGSMTGESRTRRDGVERESEKLRLFMSGDTLVYEATPSRQAMTRFGSLNTTGAEITFANPAHDFPQRIVYRRVSADSIVARIEGDRDGRRGPVAFAYARILCPASPAMSEPAFRVNSAFFALSVPKLDESRRWYAEKLGLTVTMEPPPYNGIRVAILSGGGLTVELIDNPAAVPSTGQPTLVHGFSKAGFYVDDFDATLRILRQRGVDIAMGPFPAGNGQPANAIIRDNAGNLIQFFGRP
jgi:catechol 2,3-dioxygenase-like lactoylglutathione lyase family enzyme